ncbi:DUF1648 domain-containing protein [Domibacillus iocasae]|uniref:DUF1648 domain-containing protein n=1 Tax=Domibacillus iocasae TaxID=1714016 RepID=A0A1E7DLB2_9BACI|nr:DUF1648 domain-containing protein [Domibacillus iocasae]OES43887.1 hypothetical protein BA724_12410 [Domibacillus iocasae]
MNNRRNRPKRNISKSRSEWVWDIIGFSFYISSVVFLLIIWDQLPDKVPGHYNALGEVDRWGAKTELLLLPGIGAFIIILMQVLEKFPKMHNYPERFNESNAEQFYLHSRKLVNQLKNICLLLFSVVLFESVSIWKKSCRNSDFSASYTIIEAHPFLVFIVK